MNNSINSLGNISVADLVRRASPGSATATGRFEAVISDRGVDIFTTAPRPARPAPVEPAPTAAAAVIESKPAAAVDSADPASRTNPALLESALSTAPDKQSSLAGTYNARGRQLAPAAEAPRSQLLDIIG